LGGLAGLHAFWATGSPWPLRDRAAFADAVTGQSEFPSPAACLLVAGLLASGAGVVAGWPRRRPRLRRVGAAAVTGALAVRGTLGMAGRTHLVSPGATSARFRSLDRRLYAPLCLTLAVLSAPAATDRA
jgi:Protein of unknown function (DUF3995)